MATDLASRIPAGAASHAQPSLRRVQGARRVGRACSAIREQFGSGVKSFTMYLKRGPYTEPDAQETLINRFLRALGKIQNP